MWTSVPSLSRIRLVTSGDIEAAYPLLASYATNPDAALTVKEFAIDAEGWSNRGEVWHKRDDGGLWTKGDDGALDDPAKPVDDAAHKLLEDRVRGLGLSKASTDYMLAALAWKKAHLLGRKPGTPRSFPERSDEFACAAATLLLSFCRNITQLYLGDLPWLNNALKEYLRMSNYGILPVEDRALQNLETVTVMSMTSSIMNSPDHFRRSECLEELSYFHRLPRFASLVLDGFGEYQINRGIFTPKSSSPSFKRIQMRRADVTSSVLGMLVRAPRGLEELVYSTGGLFTRQGSYWEPALKTLGKCLLTQKDTLRVLDVDVGVSSNLEPALGEVGWGWEAEIGGPDGDDEDALVEWEEDFKSYDDELRRDEYFAMDEAAGARPQYSHELPDTRAYGYTIGSLRDFDKLTHLNLTISALMGPNSRGPNYEIIADRLAMQPPFRLFEALPPNLERLCFYDYDRGANKDVDEHVDEFMEKRAELFPRLKEVLGVDAKMPAGGTLYPDINVGSSREGEYERLWERVGPETHWAEAS